MGTIRSLLWIGRGEEFAGELAADAPRLDVVWEQDLEGTASLSLDGFDALLFDATGVDEALTALAGLRRRAGSPPILIRLAAEHGARSRECLAAGATDVLIIRLGEARLGCAAVRAREERLCQAPVGSRSKGAP